MKEVERLKFEEPSWASLLPAMFKDVGIEWGSMLGTAAARSTAERDSEDTPVKDSTSLPTSGSRKRGSSDATKSTADSPSKKEQPAVSPASSSRSKKSFTVLQKLLGKLKANDGETVKAITQLNDKQHQRIQEQRESYMRCLQLAVDCGIDEASEEYFFLHDHFKDERERDAYLSLKTHEARRIWIQRAFERRR